MKEKHLEEGFKFLISNLKNKIESYNNKNNLNDLKISKNLSDELKTSWEKIKRKNNSLQDIMNIMNAVIILEYLEKE